MFVDADNAYSWGNGALRRSTDGGLKWKAVYDPGVSAIQCSSADVCIGVDAGGNLLSTTDGWETTTTLTVASRRLTDVGFASPSRVVAVGDGGTTVVSDDGGSKFSAVGGELGGTYTNLRGGGVPNMAFAVGTGGNVAATVDGGATWRLVSVPTSADIIAAAFSSQSDGYAVDRQGGLFQTKNAGTSWQTLDPGTSSKQLRDIATTSSNAVVLIAGSTLMRQPAGGRFVAVPVSKQLKGKSFTKLDMANGSVVAWGAKAIAASNGSGSGWKSVALPNPTKAKRNRLRLSAADFTSSTQGWVVDTSGRLFRTANAGKTWAQVTSLGTKATSSITFSDSRNGYVVAKHPADTSSAYVFRTSDGGATWRPQRLASGSISQGFLVATSASQAYAVVRSGGGQQQFFSTSAGGDRGSISTLSIKTKTRSIVRSALRKQKNKVTITGTLSGAVGGEQIIVSSVSPSGAVKSTVVSAGANGGSFTAVMKMTATTAFVAQWAGDSGRRSLGTKALTVTVKADKKKKKK
jgi:photosystem II stability/assembly factor-like uncharacterized protein